MKCKIQRKVDGKWENIKYDELKEVAPIDYFCDTFDPLVWIVYYDDDEETDAKGRICIVLTNSREVYKQYKKAKIPVMHSDDSEIILSKRQSLDFVIETFPDSDFVEIKQVKHEKENI